MRIRLFMTLLVAGSLIANTAVAQSTERYQGLPYSDLSESARASFDELAESELCPCEGSVQSLAECLDRPSEICPEALIGAVEAMRALYMGGTVDRARQALNDRVEALRTVHSFDVSELTPRGTEGAAVTIVEFADFECPFCRRSAASLEGIVAEMDGEVALYFMNFPLSTHQNAEEAALAAIAAGEQGRFWEFHDLLFDRQSQLSALPDPAPLLIRIARELDLDIEEFVATIDAPENYLRLSKQTQQGRRNGVNGTPSVYVNGRLYVGDYSADSIRAYISRMQGSKGESE